MSTVQPEADEGMAEQPRRSFLKHSLALLAAGTAVLIPIGTGLLAFLNPLRDSVRARLRPGGSDENGFFRVSKLADLEEGQPQAFVILADRKDAWNTYPQEPIGTVFLCRKGELVTALNSRCPHAGCDVDYQPAKTGFVCPCHDSLFSPEGVRQGASPSPRDLDTLEAQVRTDGVVWVKFQQFKTGRPDREAV